MYKSLVLDVVGSYWTFRRWRRPQQPDVWPRPAAPRQVQPSPANRRRGNVAEKNYDTPSTFLEKYVGLTKEGYFIFYSR